MTTHIPDFSDPAGTFRLFCECLHKGVNEINHPYRFYYLGTIGLDNTPQIRTMILRGFDEAKRSIWFLTDIRSPKISEIRQNSTVSLLWYDNPSRVQVRATATATIHYQDKIAKDRWILSTATSRSIFAAEVAPSTPIEGIPKLTPEINADDDLAYSRFAVVDCVFSTLDVLILSIHGNQRAIIDQLDLPIPRLQRVQA